MKNKILGLPKAAVIVIGIVITALFLVPVSYTHLTLPTICSV